MSLRHLNAVIGTAIFFPLMSFLYSDQPEILYHPGNASEILSVSEELRILNLQANHLTEDMAQEILASQADVICIQDLSAIEASDFYQFLKEDYAHFIYVDHEYTQDGLLVASKLPLKDAQYTGEGNAELLRFVLGQSVAPIAQICVSKPSLKQPISTRSDLPLLLCGAHVKPTLTSYSQTITSMSIVGLTGYGGTLTSITNTDFVITDKRSSVRVVSRKKSYASDPSTIQYIQIGHAEVSGSVDTNGEASLEASVSESKETDNGRYSAEVKGGVYQDSQGNTSGRLEMTMSIDW